MSTLQPTHTGAMVQLGWNAGPRHARVWGLAKSFTKNLSANDRYAADQRAVAALSLMWSFVRTCLPLEIVDAVEDVLDEAGMPRLATRNIEQGKLKEHLLLENIIYSFPLAQRAPPEGYLSQGYAAYVSKT
ncbi:hypothetical protein BV25DRAFT_1812114 [Artomyces pyxidatus]|uniref:Uncharacterized protein n=1 Tax=Artomyces pyxidatus TaxID=48021 RepID=A0ACB8SMT3_9AGAM|nr:hypothetical protein BV25DRAFT_1812114 [Artomyces pyxidatus]